MDNLNENEIVIPTPEQISKFMTLVFMFQVYTVFIDPEFILLSEIDNFLTELNEHYINEEESVD